jgi:hypothetical protein
MIRNRTETGFHHWARGAIQVFIAWGVPVCGSVRALFLCVGRDVLVWFVCGSARPGQCLDDRV